MTEIHQSEKYILYIEMKFKWSYKNDPIYSSVNLETSREISERVSLGQMSRRSFQILPQTLFPLNKSKTLSKTYYKK